MKMENEKSVQYEQAEKFEIDAIGKFLLGLYHQHVFSQRSGFYVSKYRMRFEFQKFVNLSENSNFKQKFEKLQDKFNIGFILHRTNYLVDTPRGSDQFLIRSKSLFQYRNEQLKEWDSRRTNGDDVFVVPSNTSETNTESEGTSVYAAAIGVGVIDPVLMDCFKVADDAESYPLSYQGSSTYSHNVDFTLSSMGCFICQLNFETVEKCEEHVEWHGEDYDFESLKKMQKLDTSIFKLSYQVCKDSHYFCFSLYTDEPNVIIDKIIIVQSRSMFYVNNNRVPFELAKSKDDKFYVDSHLFNISVEQPIVIVFHDKYSEEIRSFEQHHFMRCLAFPKINFSIRSNRLSNKNTFKCKSELPRYSVTAAMKLALQNQSKNEALCNMSTEFKKYLESNKQFTTHNMSQILNILLQIEDIDAIRKYMCLVQPNAKLRRFDNEYSLKLQVSGRIFVENVLSPYDEVIIIPNNTGVNKSTNCEATMDFFLDNSTGPSKTKQQKKNMFYGIVERVASNRVSFLCDKKLSEDETYKIIFCPARLTIRYQYRATRYYDSLSKIEKNRFFFPDPKSDQSVSGLDLDLFNPTIAGNAEQYQAVQNIAEGPNSQAPYIIFGPPGTGKTTTVVGSILQLNKLRPNTKMLVTAGSNSACDEIALRLCRVLRKSNEDMRSIVRIFSKSNDKRLDNIDDILLEASNMYGTHFYPDISLLHEYRIIVCTLSVVGKLSTGNFGKNELDEGVFTHIFVDEVAASTVAETLVGIASLITPKAHLIISGDHKQLGPILQSDHASELGLGVSLMEHLIERPCYRVDDSGNYDRSIQTRLIRNYRSHPEIVQLYGNLYYNGELMPCASVDEVALGRNWHELPNPNFPIIFHSVFGSCARIRGSVSLFNDKEIEVVMNYVKDLMCFGINGKQILQNDIGIISPYKKQYLRIQEELNLRHLYQIETGSVETFQGKEKEIIIVSFVRSFTSTLGFLENPRRLNVTISRAKSILILVGNPKTLSLNEDFRHIVEKCSLNKTMVGSVYHENPMLINGRCLDNRRTNLQMLHGLSIKDDNNENDANKRDQVKQHQNKTSNQGHNKYNNKKNKCVKLDIKKGKNTNGDDAQLGKQMKKRINPTLRLNQRQNVDKLQKLVISDVTAATTTATTSTSPSDVDFIFQSLPNVPNNQQKSAIREGQDNKSFLEIENEIHEQMRKLDLRPPAATVTSVTTATTAEIRKNVAPISSVEVSENVASLSSAVVTDNVARLSSARNANLNLKMYQVAGINTSNQYVLRTQQPTPDSSTRLATDTATQITSMSRATAVNSTTYNPSTAPRNHVSVSPYNSRPVIGETNYRPNFAPLSSAAITDNVAPLPSPRIANLNLKMYQAVGTNTSSHYVTGTQQPMPDFSTRLATGTVTESTPSSLATAVNSSTNNPSSAARIHVTGIRAADNSRPVVRETNYRTNCAPSSSAGVTDNVAPLSSARNANINLKMYQAVGTNTSSHYVSRTQPPTPGSSTRLATGTATQSTPSSRATAVNSSTNNPSAAARIHVTASPYNSRPVVRETNYRTNCAPLSSAVVTDNVAPLSSARNANLNLSMYQAVGTNTSSHVSRTQQPTPGSSTSIEIAVDANEYYFEKFVSFNVGPAASTATQSTSMSRASANVPSTAPENHVTASPYNSRPVMGETHYQLYTNPNVQLYNSIQADRARRLAEEEEKQAKSKEKSCVIA